MAWGHLVHVESTADAAQRIVDRSDFEQYVDARWAHLVRSAVLLGLDLHTAEDVTQTTLARCFLKWRRVAAAADPDAYVHRILINVVRARQRRRGTSEQPTGVIRDTAAPDQFAGVEDHHALLAALGRLAHGQREAVVLRYFDDLSEAQTAAALGVAIGTVKSRCARALAALALDPSLRIQENQ